MIAAVLFAAACVVTPTCDDVLVTNCATPTPMIRWDALANDLLAGYRLYVREGGASMTPLADLPCIWADLDEDGVFETRICRGADFAVPLQRYGTRPAATLYEYAVKAYDLLGRESVLFSNTITVCEPPIWKSGTYN